MAAGLKVDDVVFVLRIIIDDDNNIVASMSIRERLNEHRRITISVVAGAVILVIGFIVMQVLAARRTYPTRLPDAYFTIDDGKTFFAANSENIAPFDYQGKQAVRAYVFDCAGKRFVGYMERYTPEARKSLVELKKSSPQLQIYGRELKKPGDSPWVKSGDFAAVAKVADVRCPDGRTPEPVEPP